MKIGALGSFALGGLAGLKIHQTKQRSRQNGRLIRDAYDRAQSTMTTDQRDTRQGVTESLNARGILNGGSGGTVPAGSDRFVGEGMVGETGAAGTLGGQVERDLSGEFTKERRDLWNQRQSAIRQNRADTMQQYVNDVTSTAQTAAGFLTPGMPSGIQAAFGATRSLGSAGTGAIDPSMTQGPIASGGIRGAFGLSPIDGTGTPQIGVASPGTDSFDFHI